MVLENAEHKDLCHYITRMEYTKVEGSTLDFENIYNTTQMAIDSAIECEKMDYEHLEEIANGTDVQGTDVQLSYFLTREFLDERTESIEELIDLQKQKRRVGDNYAALMLMDKWLIQRIKEQNEFEHEYQSGFRYNSHKPRRSMYGDWRNYRHWDNSIYY